MVRQRIAVLAMALLAMATVMGTDGADSFLQRSIHKDQASRANSRPTGRRFLRPASKSCGLSICFLMDQSGSMSAEDWQKQKSFVAAALRALATKSRGSSKYAVVKFGSEVQTVRDLTSSSTAAEIAVKAAEQNGRQTHTSSGISRCSSILSAGHSSRARVIVLLTDGAPNLPKSGASAAAKRAAAAAKAAKQTIIIVGIKQATTQNPGLLRSLATRPSLFYPVTTFSRLNGVLNTIVSQSCAASVKPSPTASPTAAPTPTASSCALSVCWAIDQSQSITATQWAQEKSFVISAVNQLAVASGGASRNSVIKFDSAVQSVVGELTADTHTVSEKVAAAKQNRQGTYTAAGLDKCRVLLNSQASDARPKVTVLITDGHPTLPETGGASPGGAALAVATEAKSDNITIFTLGVKHNSSQPDSVLNPGLLESIASTDAFFFPISFAQLTKTVGALVASVCTAPVDPDFPPRPPSPPPPAPPPSSLPVPSPPSAPPPFVGCAGSLATFDDLPLTINSNIAVPSDYSGAAYSWTNWRVWDATGYAAIVPASGFSTGVVSPRNVAWNNFAQPASIVGVGGASFSVHSFYGTAGFLEASPLRFNVTGFDASSNQVAFASLTATVAGPTLFQLSNFTSISRLLVVSQDPNSPDSSNKQQLIVDNICLELDAAQ